jgi:hypothetical protein
MIKYIRPSDDRDKDCKITFEAGGFNYEFIADFPKYPVSDWQFIDVSSGFCDKDDNVYILMRDGASSIVKCDIDGNYLGTIKTSKYIQTPHFGCMTPDGNILVTNTFMHCAVELTPDGEFVREYGNRGVPSDTGHDNLAWRRQRRYGSLIPTEMEEVYTNVKWSDYEAWKTIVRRGEPFNKVTSCCFNSKGQVIFGDGYGNCAVHTFDRDGTLLSSWGEPSHDENGNYTPGPGKFFIVHAVECDSKDRVWAADRDADAVTVFAPDGEIVAYLQGNLGQPSDFWYDGTYMYIVGRGGYLTILNDDLEIVAQHGYYNSDLKAHGMCGNSHGDLFLFPTHANPDHQVIKLKRIH